MSQTVGYQEGKHNTVSALVDHVIFKKQLRTGWDQWFLEMALFKLRELRLDVWQDVKRGLYEVSDRKTVLLENSFVDWVVIGAQVGQYFVTMGVNDKLSLLPRENNSTDYVQGLLSQNLPNGLNSNNYTGYFFNGASFVGSGFYSKGSFRVHKAQNYKELILDYDYPFSHVYMEWITDGFDPCGETVVDPYFCDWLVKAMEFEWESNHEPNRTEASIRRRGVAMETAWIKCQGRTNDLDPQTLLNISRAAFRLTTKA